MINNSFRLFFIQYTFVVYIMQRDSAFFYNKNISYRLDFSKIQSGIVLFKFVITLENLNGARLV